MTIEPVFVAALTAFAAAVGWWFVHYLTSKRDVRNDQRKQRVEHLIQTFQDLVHLRTYQSDATLDYIPIVVRVTNNLQMFGTKKQIELFAAFAKSIDGSGIIMNAHELIDLIRNDIREMIGMDQVADTVAMFQVLQRQKSSSLDEVV